MKRSCSDRSPHFGFFSWLGLFSSLGHYPFLNFRIGFVSFAIALLWGSPTSADILNDLEERINSWYLEEAQAIFEKIPESVRQTPRAYFLKGKLLFYIGDCESALAELRTAIEGARGEIEWKSLRNLAQQAAEVYSGMEYQTGKSGQFAYRFQKGQDSILIDYAEETLTKQLQALKDVFLDVPGYTVQIDFLPDTESLARTSGLSVEQIERTGTVGVAKYGRISMISPRALATGYPWLDTLAHELTHLVITRISKTNCPIWLHEGIAKLMEYMWRGHRTGSLTPEEAYLLDRAVREGRLIPLRRFHPSVAYLPNQEDAALAYAQVLSFVLYLNSRLPSTWPKQLLEDLGNGFTIDKSLQKTSKFALKRLYMWWLQAVSGRRQTPVPAVSLLKKRFKRGKATGNDPLESLLEGDVERYVRVGDLLRLRGYGQAAAIEYRQAERLIASPSTEISDRLAGVLLELGDSQSVIPMLNTIAALYPAHHTTFVQLGEALSLEKSTGEAITALERANSINPFHPKIHCLLEEQYTLAGKSSLAQLEKSHCRLLLSQPENNNY